MDLLAYFAVAMVAIVWAVVCAVAGYMFFAVPKREAMWVPDENRYLDPKTGEMHQFPSLFDPPSLQCSIVIPAYNEYDRIDVMLRETLDHITKRQSDDRKYTWEIIVVDDGSKDKTTEKALGYVEQYGTDSFRVLTLKKNRGKGGAVKRGIMCSRGRRILFVDADGATRFSDLDLLEAELDRLDAQDADERGMAIAIGSRAHLQDSAVAKRNWYRNILMHGFHFMVYVLCVRTVKDTQCGFKLCTRIAAQHIFPIIRLERWAFDVEMLYIAEHLHIPIAEVAVAWEEIAGSKLGFRTIFEMGRDLFRVRMMYTFHSWKEPRFTD